MPTRRVRFKPSSCPFCNLPQIRRTADRKGFLISPLGSKALVAFLGRGRENESGSSQLSKCSFCEAKRNNSRDAIYRLIGAVKQAGRPDHTASAVSTASKASSCGKRNRQAREHTIRPSWDRMGKKEGRDRSNSAQEMSRTALTRVCRNLALVVSEHHTYGLSAAPRLSRYFFTDLACLSNSNRTKCPAMRGRGGVRRSVLFAFSCRTRS